MTIDIVSLFVDWLDLSNQKQIQITIWWWDEQACLMYANNIQDNFYDLVLCISLASSSRQNWSYHVYSWSLTSKLDAFLYSMVRRLHVWWWSIWFRQWNALLPNVMVFNALLPNVMHWFLIGCTGDDIFSGELGRRAASSLLTSFNMSFLSESKLQYSINLYRCPFPVLLWHHSIIVDWMG